MKQYQFFESLIIRTPLFSFHQHNAENYAAVLKDESFQLALFLASRSFYDQLEKKQFNYEQLNEKEKSSVKKYVNRASFRSTPFGLFSSFALIQWSLDATLTLSAPEANIQLDFGSMYKLWEKHLQDKADGSVRFHTNRSLYQTAIDIRYIKKETTTTNETMFSMVSIDKNTVLKKLLKFCTQSKSHTAILCFLLKEANVSMEGAEAFIKELIEQQIIVPHTSLHVTGEDYSNALHQNLNDCYETEEIKELKKAITQICFASFRSTNELLPVTNTFDKHLPFNDNKNYFYSISKRKALQGGLSGTHQKTIQEGLHCLNLLSKINTNNNLDTFKKAFVEKYESEEMPLLEVLDSQFGIGYGDFDKLKTAYQFATSSYRSSDKKSSSGNNEENDIATLLLNDWQLKQHEAWKDEVEITDDHLKKLETENNKSLLPPSLSVMFRTLHDEVVIESVAGPSALSLLGRFSGDADVYRFAKQIAAKEQALNQQVVFAEVAHVCNLHTANINRRAHLRNYEIPVLTNSTMKEERQINLNDILVSVVDDTVILRSKKLNKVIIPRLSSAFNYTKNSFPVFRFLCDVQNQHLKSNFSFSFSSLLPGLRFYPRVKYKRCILQLAEWHLDVTDFNSLKAKEPSEAFALFRELTKSINLPRYFAYTILDNFLVFDSQNADDVNFFLSEVGSKGKIVLKEFPFAEDSLVKDENRHPLTAQYIAALHLNEEVYKITKEHKKTKKQPVAIKDTKDWIYFKIYCHPNSSDFILCNYLFPLLKKYLQAGNIKNWFWIRYNDPDYHIRFRIQPHAAMKAAIFEAFTSCLSKLLSNKLVARFQPENYKREIERYSPELMQQVESVFASSSYVVCDFLKQKCMLNFSDERIMTEAAVSINKILDGFGLKQIQKAELCKFQFEQFFKEFGQPKTLKPEIEIIHKKIQKDIGSAFHDGNKQHDASLKKAIVSLFQSFEKKKVKSVTIEKLAADIVHMHLNRLYVYNQRHAEMVTYYLLYRSLNAQLHRQQQIVMA